MVQIVQRSQTINWSGPIWLELDQRDLGALNLANRIRELRERQGWTIQELAKKAGISHPTVSRVETGKTKIHNRHLAKLSAALGVEPIQLISEYPVPKSEPQAELMRLAVDLSDEEAAALIATAKAMLRTT